MDPRFEAILGAWGLADDAEVSPVGTGLINQTYRVTAGSLIFVLQKIHEVIPDAAIADMAAVTQFLAERGMNVPRLVSTRSGEWFTRDTEGGRWRLYPWMDGVVVDALTDVGQAESAGRLIGEMHRHLADVMYRPQGSIPHFHDTLFILNELQSVAEQLPDEAQTMAQQILSTLPNIMVTDEAGSAQMIHGDLKISNLLFDDSGQAGGILDFDTILFHSRAIDVGDALRSWCNRTQEDDPAAVCDRSIFSAALVGYNAGVGVGGSLTETVAKRAAAHLALELAARFLIDVVRDSYFGWDKERFADRRSHNIARAAGQFHLAQSFLADGAA